MTTPFKSLSALAQAHLRVLVVALLISLNACTDKPLSSTVDDADIALNNRGVALMGRFDYRAAVDVFSDLSQRNPKWNAVRTNYAVALKNRQEVDDGELALEQLQIVLDEEPQNLRANYVAGVLQLYLGRVEPAAKFFGAALALDPQDAYTHYYLGQCQLRSGDVAAALDSYQAAIELDPYLRSAYYSAAQVLRGMGRADEANEQLTLFQRFENNPRARLAEFKYTRMGPLSLAAVVDEGASGEGIGQEEEKSNSTELIGEMFADSRLLVKFPQATDDKFARAEITGLTTADVDRNGWQDLFLQGRLANENRLMMGALDKGLVPSFTDDETLPWLTVSDINAVAWGDIDNDGLVDAYLCRKGENQLWLQKKSSGWQVAGDAANVGDAQNDCADTTMLDADHDGDLDILIANRGAANNLLNNNRDGTFRSLADKLGSAATPANTRHILITDMDADDDVDIVFVNDDAPHTVLINDRLWNYVSSDAYNDLTSAPIMSLAAADLDADGQTELFSIDSQGAVKVWLRGENEAWYSDKVYQSSLDDTQTIDLAPLDINGNGRSELALLAEGGFDVLALTPKAGTKGWEATTAIAERYEGGMAIPVVLSTKGYSFVAIGQKAEEEGLLEWAPGVGRHEFVTVNFSGKHDAAETMRSNHSGIGTLASVRTGSHWSRTDSHKHSSIRGYSLQPLAIGLNGRDKADFIEIDWSDGVYQSELDVESGSIQNIAEEQRQLGSCPVLFVWNGQKFDFVTDILGVAAQGFLVEPGTLLPPRPWERITFPPGSLASKEGRIQFKVTEPMEENSYIDSLSLESYDVPEDWQLIVDERMGTGAPEVTGETLFYQKSLSPVRAENSAGDDVRASILKHDQRAMPPGEIDRRYIGLLETPESLTIEFDEPIDSWAERPDAFPVLIAENWVELPYSQTHFAAWQAGRQYRSISLEARDQNGLWQMIHPDFGIPGGMPRTMSLPMHSLPKGSVALRLSWNRELYWDRVRVVFAEKPSKQIAAKVSSPLLAKVVKSGFYERINHPQRRPEYVYQKRKTFGDVRYPTGFYTNLGEMTELVTASDDALAIIGPGEEIHVEFEEPLAPPKGFKRWYVLEAKGWAKDSDRFTYQGDTVGPLPRANPNASDDVREALHQKYNTRFQSGQ